MRFLSGLFCILLLFPLHVHSEDITSKNIKDAAIHGLKNYLNSIPSGSEDLYGFKAGEDLNIAVVGTPLPVRYIEFDAIQNSGNDLETGSLAKAAETWYFPVLHGGKIRALLTVEMLNGYWQAVSFGQTLLAREIGEILNAWPASSGYTPQIFTSLEARKHFFHIPQISSRNLTVINIKQSLNDQTKTTQSLFTAPLQSGYAELSDASEVISPLKSIEIGG